MANLPANINLGHIIGTRTDDVINAIAQMIIEVGVYRGQDIKTKDAVTMARLHASDLEKHFRGIDLTELRTAFEAGVKGEFGEYYGINALTLYQWVKGYADSPLRDAYLAKKRVVVPALPDRHKVHPKSSTTIEEDCNIAYCRWLHGYNATCAKYPQAIGALIKDPLMDLGKYRENTLHRYGYVGTLEEIFIKAKKEGKETLL